jgi:D-beta-D-heptose 7-phosphate kinase / D-beta-D-heptose 1-phosphate adenosyltransferase
MMNLKEKNPKILVIGDLIIDQYLWGSCNRISPEAPVQIVSIQEESNLLGGAGNVVNNLKTLGAEVDILSIIGDCENSHQLKKLLKNIKVNSKYLKIQKNRVTSKKSRLIAANQQVVRFDRENTDEISNESQNFILSTFKKNIQNYDIVLLSDYGKGILTNNLTKSIISFAKKLNKKVLVDPKGRDYSKYTGAFLLTPNINEASQATNITINDDATLKKAITQLKSIYELEISLITLSEKGLAVYDKELKIHPTVSQEVFDVTGAGDTVLASLGFALACKLDIDNAIKFSNLAAGIVVGKIGSATTNINEIIEYESSLNKPTSDMQIKTLDEIIILSKEFKLKGKKIVFTNGCFDLLHIGHIKYLEKAKSYGDILILGLNSDRSVKSIKGEKRPITNQKDRSYILAGLEAVDYVVIFDEETPYKLIKSIKPNILVKGGDYKGKNVVGEDIVDELKIVEFIKGKSSTQTIENIKKG